MRKRMSMMIAIVMVFALALSLCAITLAKDDAAESFEGTFFKLTSASDFQKGTITNLIVDDTIGDGALRLADGAVEGEYVSHIIGVEPFEYLVASWNSDTPDGTCVEVSVRAYVDMHDGWSDWMSWGEWRSDISRGSTDDSDDLAYIDTDTLTIKGSDGETASLVQVKVELKRDDASIESPALRQVAATYKNTLDGQAITPVYWEESIEQLPESVKLDTPAYSQMIREGSIGGSICSATTITTLLNDRGEDLFPEEIALTCYDSEYEGFGNWSYSVAAGAAFGYEAYVQYIDFDILKQELAKGYSVGISVKYSSTQGGGQPYLENGAANSTSGHLITITGYETIDGVDYFYSSDSAATGDTACAQLRYRADQLDECWSNRVAYIMHDKEDGAGFASPERIEASVEYVEGSENEYNLIVNGEVVELPSTFIMQMLKKDNCGVLCYTLENAECASMPDGMKVTTANKAIKYNLSVTNNGTLRLDPSKMIADADDGVAVPLTLYVICNNGNTYVANFELNKAAAQAETTEEPVVSEEAVETEAPVQTELPEETAVPVSAPAANSNSTTTIIIIAAAVVVIAVVIVIIVKKKK